MIILRRLVCQSIRPVIDGTTEAGVYGMDYSETIAEMFFGAMPASMLWLGGGRFFTRVREVVVRFRNWSRERCKRLILLLWHQYNLVGASLCRFPCHTAFVFVVKIWVSVWSLGWKLSVQWWQRGDLVIVHACHILDFTSTHALDRRHLRVRGLCANLLH